MNAGHEIEALVTDLHELGLTEFAMGIEDAVGGGSTGTEILVRVGHYLDQLLRGSVPLDDELRDRLQRVSSHIANDLKQ